MITKKKPVQTCDIDRHNKVNFPVKTKKLNLQGKIKKFPERAILLKMCANIQKYSRTGHFVKKSFGIVKNATDMLH